MAAGKHVWQRAVPKVNHKNSNGFLRPSVPSSAENNMKQVDIINKEELDKDRFQVHYRVHSPGKVKRATSCKRKSCGLAEVGVKLHRRSSDVGRLCDPGMANKENELTCSDDVRGCGFPVNSAEASKMAGASSKYSDFAELSKDHEAMTQVLFGRSLRLKVALTLWRKSASELVAYLIRIQDTGVLLDCLPVLTNNLQTEAPCLSLGCCVDLMPQVKMILTSKYEEQITVGLHWVQSVIRKWWPELSRTEKRLQDSCAEDRNMEVMKQRLKDLWKEGTRLCLVPGTTGELAKGIEAYLSQLP
ncbi:KATNB1-like protein 1 [Astatotilapia calliptera]|uniref:Katanin p80 subunit C-terminal domain-containing protein n=1 Tax=Astatotilapia calliptera TaxID=8154 RepID=A0A3P8RBQ5_ASTCA|nr:KATNB1-like protein 1 [Astatotilapia calliptera]XP_025999295.1 KATNB1-like protein 1 [Astatotilapia calliptera]